MTPLPAPSYARAGATGSPLAGQPLPASRRHRPASSLRDWSSACRRPAPLQEIRLLFTAAAEGSQRVSLTDGEAKRIGVEQSFTPFLSDADYENLRWYLEDMPIRLTQEEHYMQSGAVLDVRSVRRWPRTTRNPACSLGHGHALDGVNAAKRPHYCLQYFPESTG